MDDSVPEPVPETVPVELDDVPEPAELETVLPDVLRLTFSLNGQLANVVTGPRPDVA